MLSPASNISSTIQLSNGLEMPIFGLGTSHQGGYSHDAVVYALTQCGVCHIDTAERYGCEEQLGKAIRESMVPREDLWITNKLWPSHYGFNSAKEACLKSCKRMGLEYFDKTNTQQNTQNAFHCIY
uniref:NADP-dependent oxidoreductase domain-containing protein n=1 Tax=Periophthalmus magnuspinnatus TaxID=409849 RepID=A0A3B4AP93_9GOBI